MSHKLSKVILKLSPVAQKEILRHIYLEPTLECGGYIIGTIKNTSENVLTGSVDDIFAIEGSGTPSNFTFTSESGLKAYAYCTKMYSSGDSYQKNIIGNYHSHGNHPTFFSPVDEKMMKSSTSREFYLVYSPKEYSFTAIYKDSDATIYEVNCEYDSPGFKYIFPKTNFNKWSLINTGVDYNSLSIVKNFTANNGEVKMRNNKESSQRIGVLNPEKVKHIRDVVNNYHAKMLDIETQLSSGIQFTPKALSLLKIWGISKEEFCGNDKRISDLIKANTEILWLFHGIGLDVLKAQELEIFQKFEDALELGKKINSALK